MCCCYLWFFYKLNSLHKTSPNHCLLLTMSKKMQFSLFEKSNDLNFDQSYIKKYRHSWYEISIIRLVIEHIFIINLFGDINVNIICYKLGQTWTSLMSTHPIIAFFLGRREYNNVYNTLYYKRHIPQKYSYDIF
jgi:hypothetical protein